MAHKILPLNDKLKHASDDDDDDDEVGDYNSSDITSAIDSDTSSPTPIEVVNKKKIKTGSYHNNRYNLKNTKVPTAIMKNIVVGIMKNQVAKKLKIYDQEYNSINNSISSIEKNVKRFKLSKRAFDMIHEEAENYMSDIFSVAGDVKGKKLTLDLTSLKTAARIHTKIVNSMK